MSGLIFSDNYFRISSARTLKCVLTLGKNYSRQHFDIQCIFFFFFFQKAVSDISSIETICMKCHIMFSGENKKNIAKNRLLKITHRVLSVK